MERFHDAVEARSGRSVAKQHGRITMSYESYEQLFSLDSVLTTRL